MLRFRKIEAIGRTYRHINRYKQILRILIKYGFEDLLENLKIEHYLEIGFRLFTKKPRNRLEKLTRAERVRLALEELGPISIKLGQILSTRPDLIPLPYLKEFEKLQDSVTPCAYPEIAEIIKKEFGSNPEDLFLNFETTSLASASIAQVHRAQLKNGKTVVVKVRRASIESIVEVDLEIMLHLAGLMERHLDGLGFLRPTKIVEEFARQLEKELDFNREAAQIDRFSRQFKENPTIFVPQVFHDFTSESILTMEYIVGIKSSNIKSLKEEGYDLCEIASRGADLIMQQIFVHGYFHADPHPGNIFILPKNVLCFIDFGLMGRINRQECRDFTDLVMNIVRRNEKKVVESLLRFTIYDEEPDRNELENQLGEIIDSYLYRPLSEIEIGKLFHYFLELITKFSLTLKPHLFVMIKALIAAEGLGRTLNPDFQIIKHTEPFVRKIQLERYNPKQLASELISSGSEIMDLVKEIPGELRTILKQTREGKVKIELQHRGLDPMRFTYDRISNRIAFAIVQASLIIGSSLIVLSDIPPKWYGIPIIGIVGFLVAGVMGIWLLVTILRHGRM